MSDENSQIPAPEPNEPVAESPSAAPPVPTASAPPSASRPPRGDRPPFRRERGPREGTKPQALQPIDDLTNRGPNLRDLDASLEDELNAALAGFDGQSLVAAEKKDKAATAPGDRKKGRIVAIHGEDVFIDVPGGRSQGMMSREQFEEAAPVVGNEVEFEIDGYDRANGLLILKKKGAVQHVDWSSVAEGQVVEARVIETNKGGLAVDVNGIRGFMPISQIDLYRVEQTEPFVNQRLRCVVTEVKPEERNLVVSRRHLLERERDEQREKFWATLAVGQTRSGMVRSILPFGAFVDLGGADGLIPIGELSWTRVATADEVVKVGQRVEVQVMKLDPATRKIGLSLRALTNSPWETLEQRFYPGLIVARKITRLQDFGAFVELEPGVEGLVHISEIAPQRLSRPSAVVQVGQEVNVKVLSIDKENKRIALSIKQAVAAPEPEPEATEEVEEVVPVKPRVRNPNLRGGVGTGFFIPMPESGKPGSE